MAVEATAPETTPLEDLPLMQQVKELMKRRDALEVELEDHITELNKTPAGLTSPLIDDEGYPRADCDLHVVTKRRGRVACLRNDLRETMSMIEERLHALHSDAREQGTAAPGAGESGPTSAPETAPAPESAPDTASPADPAAELVQRYSEYPPFLTVGQVVPESPARIAGLKEGDAVVSWNGVTYQHPEPITMISQITARHENKELKVVVQRGGSLLALTVEPKKWSGRGLLGCLLNKVKK